jgi:hypothetical protein
MRINRVIVGLIRCRDLPLWGAPIEFLAGKLY